MVEKSKVLIVYTGGTIGMIEDPQSGLLKPFNFDNLSQEVPELNKLEVELEAITFETPLDSSNVNISTWITLAKIIEEHYAKYHGFVILHGSDTMAYSASALSFLLEGLSKPVIFTGSQLPIGTIRTDGKENLITAIQIAGERNQLGAVVPEVAIYFENALLRGNRTTKVSAENFEAFQSPNYPKLAEAGINIKYNKFAIRKSAESSLTVRKKVEDRIAILKLFPGITEAYVEALAKMKDIKALIIETFGSGNAPTLPWLDNILKELIANGVIVLNITQCITGSVNQVRYETGMHLQNIGVLSGMDMTFEAAVTKVMYILACEELDLEQKKSLICSNLRGEFSFYYD